ncbi:hypothetical protein KBI33_04135 [Candidatus Shapirobacteria bacterium]|nr:hypothetical protein [Candidatus Shapirobacteria bacterium]
MTKKFKVKTIVMIWKRALRLFFLPKMTKIIKKSFFAHRIISKSVSKLTPGCVRKVVDQTKAKEQWLTLFNLFRSLGVKAETVKPQPDLPDIVFSTDQALIKGGSNFDHFRLGKGEKKAKYAGNGLKIMALEFLTCLSFLILKAATLLRQTTKLFLVMAFVPAPK